MSFPQGIDFRSTNAYVTDVSPSTHHTAADVGGDGSGVSYPTTTAQSNTVGFENNSLSSRQFRDRNSGNDPRLAGMVFTAFNPDYFRIDLPSAGDYSIRTAAGDPNYANNTKITLYDNVTSLGVLSQTATTASNKFRDATDAEYTAANWVTSNTAVTKTFASTICRFLPDINNCTLSHVYIEAVAAVTSSTDFGSPLNFLIGR